MNADTLLAFGLLFQVRVDRVLDVSRNVARKEERRGVPHQFEVLLESKGHFPVSSAADDTVTVPLHSTGWMSGRSTKFQFPSYLLSASDRDIAKWARESIRFHQTKEAGHELRRAREAVQTAEAKVTGAQKSLEEAQARLRNIEKRAAAA